MIFIWFYKGFYIQELNTTLNDFIIVLAVFNQISIEFHSMSTDFKRNLI